ncbi:carbonic anhydrase 2-like [Nylanderia fulva]|uniref:carbonic anhydrase 2-like n=1 Tax=Nylanderia fulva TaxID=613905 RepID=UPI0010FB6EF2|nr:carbonic anhydrase 2-like [Nylanderia fulva]
MSISRVKMDLGHLLVTLTLLCTGLQTTVASEWGYEGKNGPENWPGICTTGKKQSPINIVTKDVVKSDLGALKFDQYNLAFPATMKNDGHSVDIRLDGVPPVLSGGNLQSTYVLEQLHLHWNAEHTVDSLRDPLELHLVHYDNQYANFSEAVQHENGVAVISVLFEPSKYDNPQLKPIVKAVKKVLKKVGKSTKIKMEVIPSSFLPEDHTYYHYQGSLTTPACQESVTWFVLTEKLTVSKSQVNVFKRFRGDHGKLPFNYRPTQELNDRKVYHYSG